MTNVFEFPKNKIVREVQPNIDEIERAKHKSLLNYADMIVDDMIGNMLDAFDNYGIEVEKEDFQKDFAFSVDALKATVYRYFGIEHSLHSFIDENVKIVPKELADVMNGEDVSEKTLEELELENEEELDNQK